MIWPRWGWERFWVVPLEEALYKCLQWMNEWIGRTISTRLIITYQEYTYRRHAETASDLSSTGQRRRFSVCQYAIQWCTPRGNCTRLQDAAEHFHSNPDLWCRSLCIDCCAFDRRRRSEWRWRFRIDKTLLMVPQYILLRVLLCLTVTNQCNILLPVTKTKRQNRAAIGS